MEVISAVTVESSNFLCNHAADREGAIAVFGQFTMVQIPQQILDGLSMLVAVRYLYQLWHLDNTTSSCAQLTMMKFARNYLATRTFPLLVNK